MTKIYVLQMDNRLTLDYLILTKKVNEKICQLFNYHYYYQYNLAINRMYFLIIFVS